MISKLVFLVVIILGVIAVAQLVRLYELSAKIRNKGEEEVGSRDNNLNAWLMLIFMVVQFGGFIYLMLHYGWTGRGEAASVHGHGIDWLLNVNFIIIISAFFLTNFLLFYFAFKYVKKPGVKAYYFPHNNRLELIWTVIPAIVLAVIIIIGLQQWNDVTDKASDQAIRVELYSKQFNWTARYAGQDNVHGKFDYKVTTDNNPLGLLTTKTIADAVDNMLNNPIQGINVMIAKLNDNTIMLSREERSKFETTLHRSEKLYRLLVQMQKRHNKKLDAQANDDIILTGPVEKLYLCKGKEYEFTFRSRDVIHSAYFPNFRAQMNAVPGLITRFKFIPDKTTAEMRRQKKDPNFDYVLLCNKICGGSHYKMNMLVEVLEENEYYALMKAYAIGNADVAITTHRFKDVYDAAMNPPAPDLNVDSTIVVTAD
jgi:cytochrome c oxidase subunit 2